MNKTAALRIVNMVLVFSFIVQVITVIIIFFKIKTNFSHLVFEVHEHNGIFMIMVVATHITLNWGWIKTNFLRNSKL